MNKAFTREMDDAPPAPQEERPVSTALNMVTPRGAQLIKEHIVAIQKKLALDLDPVTQSALRRDLRYPEPFGTLSELTELSLPQFICLGHVDIYALSSESGRRFQNGYSV